MSSSRAKGKSDSRAASTDAFVWVVMIIAVLATLYFLMHEPEEGPPRELSRPMAQARMVALGAALLGAVPGVHRILREGGEENLFAMAVLFNVILACFWILRFVLSP